MKTLQSPFCREFFYRRCRLDFFWIAGLCFGYAVGRLCQEVPLPQVFVPDPGNLLSALFPLAFGPLVSLLLALVFPWQILLWIAFLRGTALTFVWCVLYGVFRPAGWIFCPILLLAELLMTPILFFLWLRLLSGSWERAVYVLLLCLSCAAAVGFISYCMVMPVSAFLIDGAFGGLAS